MLDGLEDEHPGALPDDEAVAALVERAGRGGRIVVAGRERAHRAEGADPGLADAGLGPAGDHHVGVTAADRLPRLADGLPAFGLGLGSTIVGGVAIDGQHLDYVEFVAASGMDSVTQYELWKAIWSSLNDGNFFELAYALERHDALLDTFVPQTFVGNHDVTRIATKLDDERHLGHALAILFTVAGVPSVYYRDEQAFRGLKEDRLGGDDAIRPAVPARMTVSPIRIWRRPSQRLLSRAWTHAPAVHASVEPVTARPAREIRSRTS